MQRRKLQLWKEMLSVAGSDEMLSVTGSEEMYETWETAIMEGDVERRG